MQDFIKQVEALCKEHGITSFGNMCYNDPDLCKQQEIDFPKYEKEAREWENKRLEYVKINPEPYGTYSAGWSAWRKKLVETIGSYPYAPGDNLHFDYDKDDSPKPGVWFSSKC